MRSIRAIPEESFWPDAFRIWSARNSGETLAMAPPANTLVSTRLMLSSLSSPILSPPTFTLGDCGSGRYEMVRYAVRRVLPGMPGAPSTGSHFDDGVIPGFGIWLTEFSSMSVNKDTFRHLSSRTSDCLLSPSARSSQWVIQGPRIPVLHQKCCRIPATGVRRFRPQYRIKHGTTIPASLSTGEFCFEPVSARHHGLLYHFRPAVLPVSFLPLALTLFRTAPQTVEI